MLTSSGDHMVLVRCCLWVKKGHLTSADRPEECQLQLRLRPETFAMSFSPRRVWNIITHADIVKLAIKSLGVPLNRNVIRTFLLLFFFLQEDGVVILNRVIDLFKIKTLARWEFTSDRVKTYLFTYNSVQFTRWSQAEYDIFTRKKSQILLSGDNVWSQNAYNCLFFEFYDRLLHILWFQIYLR